MYSYVCMGCVHKVFAGSINAWFEYIQKSIKDMNKELKGTKREFV